MAAIRWLNCGLLLGVLWSTQFSVVVAQSVTVSGYVEDMASGERILGASVSIPALQIGTTTNQYGFYSLTISSGSPLLLVSHVGYESLLNQLQIDQDTTLIITLIPRIVELEDVEVFAEGESDLGVVQMSRHEISIEEIETLPVIFGEIDIQKTLQLLPGVQSGLEGTSGLYVRGGRADQNLILLDGLPLYNPNHLFGFFSVFNSAAMKRVELIKGAFPARYGGRLSSVINYTMKEGNLKRFSGEGAIGLISSRIMLEGPIVRDRASFLVAGRRTYIDQLLRPFQIGRNTRYGGSFYDLNIKANYVLSQRDRIYLSGYLGRDGFSYKKSIPVPDADDKLEYDLGWRNRLVSLRWNRLIGDRMFANTLIGLTQYRFASSTYSLDTADSESIEYDQLWYSEVSDWTAKIEFEYVPNSQHYIRFGAEGILHRFTPGSTQTRLDESGSPPVNLLQTPTGVLNSQEVALYAEDEMHLQRVLRVTAGIRFSSYFASGTQFNSLEPRLGVNVRITKSTAVKASFAQSKQYVHLLTGGGAAFPTDLWIPSMDRVPPQSGYQIAAGVLKSFQGGRYQVSVEGYYKRMRGHIEYKLGADKYQAAFLAWPDLIESGKGFSRGAELFLQKKSGRLTGWAGYTWAKTTRQFEFLNGGHSYSDGYDRRHDISVVMQYKLTNRMQLSAVWVYGSGYPVSVPTGRYVIGSLFEFGYPYHVVESGPINSARAPEYHRLDMSINFRKKKSWAERTITLGLYNVYNRQNPMFVYTTVEEVDGALISFKKLSLLQLIPAISWQYSF